MQALQADGPHGIVHPLMAWQRPVEAISRIEGGGVASDGMAAKMVRVRSLVRIHGLATRLGQAANLACGTQPSCPDCGSWCAGEEPEALASRVGAARPRTAGRTRSRCSSWAIPAKRRDAAKHEVRDADGVAGALFALFVELMALFERPSRRETAHA